jgi:hypothetical protein
MGAGLQQHEMTCDAAVTVPLSFLDYSASRVGRTWTEEDHAALLRHLAQVDELCIAIWKYLRKEPSGAADLSQSGHAG